MGRIGLFSLADSASRATEGQCDGEYLIVVGNDIGIE